MENLLEVRSLHTLYGDSHVLHGVSFDIQPGQAVSPSLGVKVAQRLKNSEAL